MTAIYTKEYTSASGHMIKAQTVQSHNPEWYTVEIIDNGAHPKAHDAQRTFKGRQNATDNAWRVVGAYIGRIDLEWKTEQENTRTEPVTLERAFHEAVETYRKQQSLRSWSAALTQLASIGYKLETGKEPPEAAGSLGRIRPIKSNSDTNN